MRKVLSKIPFRAYFIVACVLIMLLIFWTDPSPQLKGTIKIYDRNGVLLHESAGTVGHQLYVPIESISQDFIDAVVLAEDERFWQHSGIDVIAIGRALRQNIAESRIVSGASTIPQQLVRYSTISPRGFASVNIFRKIRESLMAIRLTASESKMAILERYINSVNFGRQTYGVETAARLYTNKPADTLSLAESALFAGMIANPVKFDPILYPQEALVRRNGILKSMFESSAVSQEEYQRAILEPLPEEIYSQTLIAPHLVDMVLEDTDKMNLDSDDGLVIKTTIDSALYEYIRKTANHHIEQLFDRHNITNAGVVVIENSTGEVRALLGSVNYFDTKIEGKNNMALALRQPGSAIKPVTYAAAFENRIATAATLIEDVPKTYLTKDGAGFLPNNYDGRYRGNVLVREALASSYNLPAVEMLSRIGIERFINLAHEMGITSLNETERYDLALTLGGGEVRLIELTNLFATFARGGEWLPYSYITSIETDEGQELYRNTQAQPKKVLSEQTAWLVTDILSDEKARIPTFGEKNALVTTFPSAAKTGTTTDWHDNWTIGYTPDVTVGVWVGNADNSAMDDITGVTGAAPIWNTIITEISRFNAEKSFAMPSDITTAEVCAWDGLLASDFCKERYQEYFWSGTEPTLVTSLTNKPQLSGSRVQIISPKNGAVYEVGANAEREAIRFALSQNENIDTVEWKLNGKVLADCGSLLVCEWRPVAGNHLLSASVLTAEDEQIDLDPIEFSVLEYKQGW